MRCMVFAARYATTLNILRYVQNHTLDDPLNEQMSRARGGMEPPYGGVAELWGRPALRSPPLSGVRRVGVVTATMPLGANVKTYCPYVIFRQHSL